jgi:hypothetical protein
MTERTQKVLAAILFIGLLTTLILKLMRVPGGLILSGLFLGGMVIGLILLGCLVLTFLLKLYFKKVSFLTIYFLTTAICFMGFHYQLYSPTLRIVVPENYSGEISLVLSDVKDNILLVDGNGIGYINQWTFGKTYTKPIVVDNNGKDLGEFCVGFNPSTFWALGKSCCIDGQQLLYKSFKVQTDNTRNDEYESTSLINLVDLKLIKTVKPDRYTSVQTHP